jgi:hypothetical protein
VGTAIGDLVVSLGLENQQFIAALNGSGASLNEFAGHADEGSRGLGELGEHGEEASVGLTGASRSFEFLGKKVGELGEHLGASNKGLGETVTGLGSTVSGLGEAVHGYHALHTSIEVATAAQALLNSISPLGWTALAAGAVAAAGAYFYFSSAADHAAEAAKKLAEEQKEASKETDSAIAELQKEADKLNKTPLRQFQEELARTGHSATAIAEATEKFKLLQNIIAAGKHNELSKKIDEELSHKERELGQEGWTEGMKFAANIDPHASQQQHDRARDLGLRQDDQKLDDKANRDAEADRLRAMGQVRSLVESAKSPLDRLVDAEHALMSDFNRGLIDRGEYETGLHALGTKTEEMLPKEKQEKMEPLAALEMNSAQAFEEIFKLQNPDGAADNAKETAENTAKANDLLQELVFKMDQSAFAIR